MMGLILSRRARIALLVVLLLGFILFLPMRVALGLAGLERLGVAARDVRGTVWSGRIDQLMLGDMPMGSRSAETVTMSRMLGLSGSRTTLENSTVGPGSAT